MVAWLRTLDVLAGVWRLIPGTHVSAYMGSGDPFLRIPEDLEPSSDLLWNQVHLYT